MKKKLIVSSMSILLAAVFLIGIGYRLIMETNLCHRSNMEATITIGDPNELPIELSGGFASFCECIDFIEITE